MVHCGDENRPELAALGDTAVLLPQEYDGISAVFSGAVFAQMFACLCSLSRGFDPDNPKGVQQKDRHSVTADTA